MKWNKRPIIFDHNRITRSYIGGQLLNEWRGMQAVADGHDCEELLVTSIGAISEGKPEGYAISKTLEGFSLQELIKEDPEGILGTAYHQADPNQLSVLARAGDTIVRLVMQCHPRQEDAQRYFHERNGKCEAWYIARTRAGMDACVYAGFQEGVTPALWQELIERQDIERMLSCLHRIEVKEGDVILIPAGMPHAVGPGCIFLELHECSDITIRVERNINGVTLSDQEMYNGLHQEDGLKLFDYTTYCREEIEQVCVMKEHDEQYLQGSRMTKAIDEEHTKAFGMNILYIDGCLPLPAFDGHRVLIPTDGDLWIDCEGERYVIKQGWGCLLPAQIGAIELKTKGKAKAVLGLPRNIMSDRLQFHAPMNILFGMHRLQELPQEVVGDRIFIVMDRFLYDAGLRVQINALLANHQLTYFTEFASNPDVVAMNQALNRIREVEATCVIGIGGGSTLDIAKFLAVAMKETLSVEELRKTGFRKKCKIKSICIPTTAGTGSEVTNVSVISDYALHQKSPFVNDLLFADTALLDPALTLSMPKDVTSSCGMDTFCHAIEAYWNKNANAMSDLLAVEALRLTFANLHTCYTHGEDEEARSQMLKASLYAGLAFAQTRTTILHAVSFPLTSLYHIPHGLACAILLPSCIRFFAKESSKLQLLAQTLGFVDGAAMADAAEQLMKAMNMKMRLQDHGIQEADLKGIATACLKEKIAYLCVREVSEDELIELLKGVY